MFDRMIHRISMILRKVPGYAPLPAPAVPQLVIDRSKARRKRFVHRIDRQGRAFARFERSRRAKMRTGGQTDGVSNGGRKRQPPSKERVGKKAACSYPTAPSLNAA